MASYRIAWKRSASRELRKLEKETVSTIVKAVESLAEEPYPRGSRKLKGTMKRKIAVAKVRKI